MDQKVFYVGCTSNVKNRRLQHYKRFASEFYGMPPVFTIIDTVSCYAGIWAGLGLERYWINYYKSIGAELLNKREMKWDSFNIEYHKYRTLLSDSTVLNYRKIPERA